MRQRDPFGEAVETVRLRVRSGALAPGAPLIVEDLARDLHLSPTPVREALAHLAGRGVIDGRREGARGYAAWPLTGSDLADLYQFQDTLAGFAIAQVARHPRVPSGEHPPSSQGADPAHRAEAFFAHVARRAGNRPLAQAQSNLADRLALARTVEPQLLEDVAAELAALEAHGLIGLTLIPAIQAYHRRRIDLAVLIAQAATEWRPAEVRPAGL